MLSHRCQFPESGFPMADGITATWMPLTFLYKLFFPAREESPFPISGPISWRKAAIWFDYAGSKAGLLFQILYCFAVFVCRAVPKPNALERCLFALIVLTTACLSFPDMLSSSILPAPWWLHMLLSPCIMPKPASELELKEKFVINSSVGLTIASLIFHENEVPRALPIVYSCDKEQSESVSAIKQPGTQQFW